MHTAGTWCRCRFERARESESFVNQNASRAPRMSTMLWLLVALLSCHGICAKYVLINSKSNGVVFKYRDGVNGEKGLEECQEDEVCNVVHDRFWMLPLAERLCRCPNGLECPWDKSSKNSSMKVNNRSVLKHCQSTTKRRTCKPKQTAVAVTGKGDVNNTYMVPYKVLTKCECPHTHYWRLQKFVYDDNDDLFQLFRCVKQRVCESYDFCGYARTDLFSIYYRCTCPVGNLCIFKDKNVVNVQELLYTGSAYKAYCYPFKT